MGIPTKMNNFELQLAPTLRIVIEDEFEDILEECSLWIAQEQNKYGEDKLPKYTWELFDNIKKVYAINIDENE